MNLKRIFYLLKEMFKKVFVIIFLLLSFAAISTAQKPPAKVDTVMVLPFENISSKPEFNWVGESFANAISDLLRDKELRVPGLNSTSNEERKILQQKLRIPLTTLPSLATSLKLARESKASLLVFGKYNITPGEADVPALTVTMRIIRVNEGRFYSEELPDGKRQPARESNIRNALTLLQTVQGQLAFDIMYKHEGNLLPTPQKKFEERANKVPAKAFETYIKGLVTENITVKENFFKKAIQFYREAKTEGNPDAKDIAYTDAALELGHLYLNQKNYQNAVGYFGMISDTDPHYAEAAFYTGMIHWSQGNFESALSVLGKLADDLKLTAVYSTIGAISVQASLIESNRSKAIQLEDGLKYLKEAAESDPDDPVIRFNYGYALFLNNKIKEAVEQIRPVLTSNPRDGEAYFVLAKAFEKLGDENAKTFDEQAKRFLTLNNTYAKLQTEWEKTKQISGIAVRVDQPARKDFVSVVMVREKQDASAQTQVVSENDALLEQARTFYKSGRDDEALNLLRRILFNDPWVPQARYLQGKIYLRRGDMDQAIDAMRTALFYDSQLIDAHISLAKIYIEKKDCLQATNYWNLANTIDAENAEVKGLAREVERCSK